MTSLSFSPADETAYQLSLACAFECSQRLQKDYDVVLHMRMPGSRDAVTFRHVPSEQTKTMGNTALVLCTIAWIERGVTKHVRIDWVCPLLSKEIREYTCKKLDEHRMSFMQSEAEETNLAKK